MGLTVAILKLHERDSTDSMAHLAKTVESLLLRLQETPPEVVFIAQL